jgi:hypothetical protein
MFMRCYGVLVSDVTILMGRRKYILSVMHKSIRIKNESIQSPEGEHGGHVMSAWRSSRYVLPIKLSDMSMLYSYCSLCASTMYYVV